MKNAKPKKNAVTLSVKVTPRAHKSEILGWEGEVLRVRLKANPEKGEANDELTRLLAEAFHLSKSQIHLIRGHKSRLKHLRIEGLSPELLAQKMRK